MEIKRVKSLKGIINVPGDKSISHRAVMLGSIAEGNTYITGFLNGEDCMSTISCFREMGVEIDIKGTDVRVKGVGLHGLKAPKSILDIGNSGTTARIMTGILAGQDFECVIDGDESIRKRPMTRVTEPLALMGANIEHTNGKCPLKIKGGKLTGKDITIPIASAQVKSALLMAGLYADGETRVTEPSLSRNHTEIMLKVFGGNIETQSTTSVVRKCERLKGININVPGDISSAAFFIVAALIIPGSNITIKNVGINSTRTGIIDALKSMGADITITNINNDAEPYGDITVKHSNLKGTIVEGSIIPRMIDELPIFAVASLFAEGETIIKDAEELKHKESNRIAALVNEFKKCGADVSETSDGMIIRGGRYLRGAEFETYNDHRIAMSMAVLASAIEEKSKILNPEVVSISYPTFFEDFKILAGVK